MRHQIRVVEDDRTRVIRKDRHADILFPFLFVIMFNILLGNTGAGDQRLELHLATRETGGISQQIIQGMVTTDESQLKPGDPIIILEKDYSQARAAVEAGKLNGFLAFPDDFTQNLMAGKNTSLEIVAQAEATDTRMALNGLARSIASVIGSETTEINAVVALLVQQGSSLHFSLVDNTRSLPVAYQGTVPDTFKPGNDVVVEGKLDSSHIFEAKSILTKCASKYVPGS
jgi:cytochrome c-type biogenesis protein CcmE